MDINPKSEPCEKVYSFSKINNTTCSSCNSTFDSSNCNSGNCWCNTYPMVDELVLDGECLCELCLKAEVVTLIDDLMCNLTSENIKKVHAMGRSRRPQQDIDYTLTPEGYKKFTGWYLLRQGSCCGNDCSNCPY